MDVSYISRNRSITDCNISNFDFVINSLPFTSETKNYFTAETFDKMNKNSYIINVGRGETINENDLYNALKHKKIRGAFVDVVQNEPIKDNNLLWELDNIFISPHIANAMDNSIETQVKVFTNKLKKYKQKI